MPPKLQGLHVIHIIVLKTKTDMTTQCNVVICIEFWNRKKDVDWKQKWTNLNNISILVNNIIYFNILISKCWQIYDDYVKYQH